MSVKYLPFLVETRAIEEKFGLGAIYTKKMFVAQDVKEEFNLNSISTALLPLLFNGTSGPSGI